MPNDEISLYHQLLLVALNNKRNPDYEYQHRCLARWFSATFSTPYAQAEGMHFEALLLHKLEHDLESISPKKVDTLFRKEFLTKHKEAKEEEVLQAHDEAWAQNIAAAAFKKKEKQLEEAESELIKEKDKLPEGVIPPADISRKF